MPAALGPRFVLEAGFLILLAVVAGLADLSPALIILVMAIGWLFVAMLEYFAWRQSPAFTDASRYGAVAEPPPMRETLREEVVEDAAPARPPAPAPAPAEEETAIEPVAASAAEPEAPAAFRPEPQQQVRYSLEPLQPRPRRRWILFGPRDRIEGPDEGSSEEER
jgi:hypothetical protein